MLSDGVFAIAQCLGIQPYIHIDRADMWHVLVFQQEPRDRAADNGELALEAAQDLPYFNKHCLDGRCGAVVVLGGGLRLARGQFGHWSLSCRR